jgi:hypothetical protein
MRLDQIRRLNTALPLEREAIQEIETALDSINASNTAEPGAGVSADKPRR